MENKLDKLVFIRFYETEEQILNRVYKKLVDKGLDKKQFHLEYDWEKSSLLTVVFKEQL